MLRSNLQGRQTGPQSDLGLLGDCLGTAYELSTRADRKMVYVFINSFSLSWRTCSRGLHLPATPSFLHVDLALTVRKITAFSFIKKLPVYIHREKLKKSQASHQQCLLWGIFSFPQNISHIEISK